AEQLPLAHPQAHAFQRGEVPELLPDAGELEEVRHFGSDFELYRLFHSARILSRFFAANAKSFLISRVSRSAGMCGSTGLTSGCATMAKFFEYATFASLVATQSISFL